MIRINQEQKDQLWWLIISVDYDYSRICIADHDISDDWLTLWLEDKKAFKNTLDECLQLEIPAKQFARMIRAEKLNAYEGSKMHPTKNYVYRAWIEINEPIAWYLYDASPAEQQWAREIVLKKLLTQLVETEAHGIEEWV